MIFHPMFYAKQAKFLQYLDAVAFVALLFTAVVTPVEVAFMPVPTSVDALFVINRIIDIIFIIVRMTRTRCRVVISSPRLTCVGTRLYCWFPSGFLPELRDSQV
jgi:hypothetical protein